MSSQDTAKARSETLKAEGNALYVARKFRKAYEKYTKAIEADDRNAILYANRAACSLELRNYVNAKSDAYKVHTMFVLSSDECYVVNFANICYAKATQLDPKYVKAWARLGKACMVLCSYSEAAEAWKNALALYIPSNDVTLTPADEQQRRSCEEGMQDAKDAMERQKQLEGTARSVSVIPTADLQKFAWKRAEKMEAETQKLGFSSAWVILKAYQDFRQGCDDMAKTCMRNGGLMGPTGVIAHISNGILRDPRVFVMDRPDWIKQYNNQIMMEAKFFGAWVEGPEVVKKQALSMLKEKGWDSLRVALGITVRGWFMRGIMEGRGSYNQKSALKYFGFALSMLEWGLEVWKDVLDEDRGVIFSSTFVRGIRRFYLETYAACWKEHGEADGFSLDEADRLAQEMIKDVQANKLTGSEDYDAGFVGSFFAYPMAEAYTIRGFVCMEQAKKAIKSDPNLAKDYYEESASMYIEASKLYPADEEMRLNFLYVAFEAHYFKGSSMAVILAICTVIRTDLPQVTKIWEPGLYCKELPGYIQRVLNYEARATLGLASGLYAGDCPSTLIDLLDC